MNKLLASAAALTLFAGSAQAGGYVQIHAGLFQQTADTVAFASDNFLGEVVDVDVDSDADLGAVLGGLVGYYVLPFVAVEGEVTLRTASMEEVTVDNVETALQDDPRTIAYMANAVLRPTFPLLPDPYIGIGAGYLTNNFNTIGGEDVDGQLAYQIKAGVSFGFPLIPGTIGVEANYLATDDFDLSGDFGGDLVNTEFSYGGVSGLLTYKIGF
ncbi:outer membrane beta-barrel protein [Parvularcula maris]|uniref:Porin family protein n=1 Tax=Parvularcula maris TaxID=2965077 RepID=A0A9X2LCV2_9PROT|nr:outer membrane beta-barrel protein [Parvularcula maris]MCQ8186187.1 porin family protein [Parvularcula maris]